MSKSSKYSLITLGVLGLATLIVGVNYLIQQTVGANPETTTNSPTSQYSVPLKNGTNNLTNGQIPLTIESSVIGIRGSLMTVRTAVERGIIGEIKDSDGKVLGREVESVGKNKSFTIEVPSDSTAAASFYPERLGP